MLKSVLSSRPLAEGYVVWDCISVDQARVNPVEKKQINKQINALLA